MIKHLIRAFTGFKQVHFKKIDFVSVSLYLYRKCNRQDSDCKPIKQVCLLTEFIFFVMFQGIGPAGLLASFDTGLYSDSSWWCTTLSGPPANPPHWSLPTYNPSGWPTTKVTQNSQDRELAWVSLCLQVVKITGKGKVWVYCLDQVKTSLLTSPIRVSSILYTKLWSASCISAYQILASLITGPAYTPTLF